MYEVPRPPRRGSHRPEAVFDYARQTVPRKMSPSWMNMMSGSPTTVSSTVSVARPSLPAEQSSVLGKRMQTAISPIMSKEEQDQFLDVERVLMSSRVRKNFRNETTCAQQVSRYLVESRNYQHAVKQECENPISTRSSPNLKVDKLRAPVSVDLVSQMSFGVHNTLSPQRSILESYTQTMLLSASCQTVQKRCMYPDCTKISVSRGLCRGHGGGRRCHFAGCSKSAQSRSTFCWAHGGGQRCEVQGCMRSRKSKRFCAAHVHFENTGWLNSGTSTDWRMQERRGTWEGQPVPCKQQAPALQRYLPSLDQALSSASRSPPNLPCL
ncbi:hypothetical protein FI667_g17061, partial [Globisporangium splendens]